MARLTSRTPILSTAPRRSRGSRIALRSLQRVRETSHVPWSIQSEQSDRITHPRTRRRGAAQSPSLPVEASPFLVLPQRAIADKQRELSAPQPVREQIRESSEGFPVCRRTSQPFLE